MKNAFGAAVLLSALTTVSSQVLANDFNLNEPPPLNSLIDLTGQPVPGATPKQYSANFVATGTSTTITFAFRHDPGFFALDNASVVDVATPGVNLLVNGSFEANLSSPDGWSFFNPYNATFAGFVSTSVDLLYAQDGNNFWYDGAVGAYDGIDQTIVTTPGQNYTLSFWLSQENYSGITTFQPLNTIVSNGTDGTNGNGVDMMAYALSNGTPTVPAPVPEPETYAMMLAGLGLLGFMGRRRKQKAA